MTHTYSRVFAETLWTDGTDGKERMSHTRNILRGGKPIYVGVPHPGKAGVDDDAALESSVTSSRVIERHSRREPDKSRPVTHY